MAAIKLEYNQQSISVQKTLIDIISVALFNIKTMFRRKSGIERALEDVRKGRVYYAENAESLIAQCLK